MKINTDTTRRIGLILILGLSVALLDIKLARAEAKAESDSGFYVLSQLGLATVPDVKLTAPGTDIELNKINHNLGWTFGAAVGYKKNYIRLELESMFTYATHDMGEMSIYNATGNTVMLAVMSNVYVDMFDYDFDGTTGRFVPYVGIGAGYARIVPTQKISMFGIDIEESAVINSLGVQGMLGVKYYITEEYAIDFKYKLLVIPGSTLETNYKQKMDYNTFAISTFNVGLSYSF